MIIMLLPQVLEARNLPDTDNFFLSKLINRKDVTDPYVSGYLDTTKVKMRACMLQLTQCIQMKIRAGVHDVDQGQHLEP